MHLAGGDPGGLRASADAERSAGFSAVEPAAAGGERDGKPGQAGPPEAEPPGRAPAAPATKPPSADFGSPPLVTLGTCIFYLHIKCKIITLSLHHGCLCICSAAHVSHLIQCKCLRMQASSRRPPALFETRGVYACRRSGHQAMTQGAGSGPACEHAAAVRHAWQADD